MSHSNNILRNIWISAILIYPLLFIWQCGDLTDTGFLAFNYSNFSNSLTTGTFNSETLITNFSGFYWMSFFPGYEILSLKFLFILLTYLSLFFSYQILKKFSQNINLLLLSLFMGELLFVRYTSFIFSKDIMSWSLILASLACITKEKNEKLFLFIGGGIILLATFSRLPNILLIPLYSLFIYLESNKYEYTFYQIIKNRLFFLFSGFLGGFILFNLLLWNSSILDDFYHNFNLVKKTVSEDSSSYSLSQLLKIYIKETIVFLKLAFVFISSMILLSWVSSRAEKHLFKVIFILGTLLFIIGNFYYYFGYNYSSKFKYLPAIFCLPPLIWALFKNKKWSFFILLILSLSFLQVFGSNTGLFLKSSFSMTLLIPMTVIILINNENFSQWNISLNNKIYLNVSLITLSLISITSRIGGIYHVTEGIDARLSCTYPIKTSKMYGLYTTKERKEHIEMMQKAIHENCSQSRTVFIYGHQPLFYFLTDTYPPEGIAWLKNKVVSKNQVFKQLNKEIKTQEILVVDTKEKIFGDEGEAELRQFLQEYNFRKVSETSTFVIWIMNN
jgi:hypothetical protein